MSSFDDSAAQQFYKVNLPRLTWGELWRASGNPLGFAFIAPLAALFKVLHVPLPLGDRMPREISFRGLDEQEFEQCRPRVEAMLQGTEALGFEHFTTFVIPEMPYKSTVFALLHRQANAYAAIYHVITPLGTKVLMDIVTRFRDGAFVMTTNSRQAMTLAVPEHIHRYLLNKGAPDAMWADHQQKVAELAGRHGGVRGPVGPDDFVDAFRGSFREQADFNVSRKVYLPA